MVDVEFPGGFEDTSDAAIARYLAELRWGDDPACGCGGSRWQLPSRPRVFACSRCPRRRSVTAGTLLHRARIPLWYVLVLAWNLTREVQPSARALARALRLRGETVWRWCHRLRAALVQIPVTLKGHLCSRPVRLPVQASPGGRVSVEGLSPTRAALALRRRPTDVHVVTGMHVHGVHVVVGRRPEEAMIERYGLEVQPRIVRGILGDLGWVVEAELRRQIRQIARGVGGRWLERYAAFAARRPTLASADAMLGLALAGPVVPFRCLAPGRGPLDDAYAPRVRDLVVSPWSRCSEFTSAPCEASARLRATWRHPEKASTGEVRHGMRRERSVGVPP